MLPEKEQRVFSQAQKVQPGCAVGMLGVVVVDVVVVVVVGAVVEVVVVGVAVVVVVVVLVVGVEIDRRIIAVAGDRVTDVTEAPLAAR
jgi:hypothetical protein